tara:strand:+ start:672 stop:824 length:153 start_codon:yes stop_codon:yes gene_type:complete
MYFIQDRQAGNVLKVFKTKEEVQQTLINYEEKDKKENIFQPNFYEIVKEF